VAGAGNDYVGPRGSHDPLSTGTGLDRHCAAKTSSGGTRVDGKGRNEAQGKDKKQDSLELRSPRSIERASL
jgi:hypothetical protein